MAAVIPGRRRNPPSPGGQRHLHCWSTALWRMKPVRPSRLWRKKKLDNDSFFGPLSSWAGFSLQPITSLKTNRHTADYRRWPTAHPLVFFSASARRLVASLSASVPLLAQTAIAHSPSFWSPARTEARRAELSRASGQRCSA